MAAEGQRARGALPGPELELAAASGTLSNYEIDTEVIPLVGDRSQGPSASQRNLAAAAAAAAATATAPGQRSPLLFFTLIASLGGLLFGYDTGCISGALPYIRDDILLPRFAGQPAALAHWQELIVSAAIVAAGVGSVLGGWVADRLGRKAALLLADVLFAAGSAAMAAAQGHWALIAGRALVGLGVGLASVTVPILIAECAPPARRASLVTVNVLAITGGQFVAYVADFLFSFVPGTWRWMLGIAALPALLQMAGLSLLPESPRWLASKGRTAAAERALQQLQPGRVSAAAVVTGKGSSGGTDGGASSSGVVGGSEAGSSIGTGTFSWRLLRSRTVLKELHVGVGLQILQQVAGINTVMYFTPSILQLAGVGNQAALLLAMLPALTNAVGTIVGMRVIDRAGRRRLLLASIAAVAVALAALGSAFLAAERHSPAVLDGSTSGNSSSGGSPLSSTCPAAAADCTGCLRQGCGFCGGSADGLMAPGVCLAVTAQQAADAAEGGSGSVGQPGSCAAPARLFLHGCPSQHTWLILFCLVAYLAAFSPGLGPVPWAVNAEIYPLQVRGIATGIAATSNWVANAVVAQTFLTLTQRLGGSGTFFLYCGIAVGGFAWTYRFLPETNGLSLEQVQRLFAGNGGGGEGGGAACGSGREPKWRGSDDGGGDTERLAGEVEL